MTCLGAELNLINLEPVQETQSARQRSYHDHIFTPLQAPAGLAPGTALFGMMALIHRVLRESNRCRAR
jgi:hypothetical protein